MPTIQISIIIPVYNAEKFLEKAVYSALQQPQCGEVILIEDRSPDKCYDIAKRLAEVNPKVKLLTHPNHENRGAGASRNMGMQEAKFPYIAFLDADDYYLPGRFIKTEEIFLNQPEVDGVYEACGFEFHSEAAKEYEIRDAKLSDEKLKDHLYTITEEIAPDDFFYRWVKGNIGYFQTNGLTFKKDLLEKTGNMDTELRLHQDTEFYYRLAAMGSLVPGKRLKPVAIIGRHDNNRITNRTKKDVKYQILVWKKLLQFIKRNLTEIDARAVKHVLRNRAIFYDSTYTITNRYVRVGFRFLNWGRVLLSNLSLVRYLFVRS
jgi:glycosyltransferase involved in cell wall biosynthesis